MDEFDEFSEHREKRVPGQQLGEWVRDNRIVILYGLMLIAVMFCRGLWGLDEQRTSDLTQVLVERGKWLPPASMATFPGGPPILFIWLAKLSSMLAGFLGSGNAPEHPAWPLRIPLVIGSILFLHHFRRWATRFLQADVAGIATLILCATPLWFWQSQAIQADLLFSAALAWSWLCWLAGYMLLRRQAEGSEDEHQSWFRWSHAWLGLAFLFRGPQALLLSALLLFLFLAWQKDLKAGQATMMNWGSAILLALVFAGYASGLVGLPDIRNGLHRCLQVQPIWIYAEHLARDSFPWLLLLPALAVFLRGSGALKAPTARFLAIAFLVPFLFSIWGDGKRGADPLAAYPFLALLLAGLLQPVYVEGVSAARIRRIGAILAAALWLAFLAGFVVGVFRLGGPDIQSVAAPMLGPLRLATLVLAMGALSVSVRCAAGEGEFLVRETAATVCVAFFIIGTWGFHGLDPQIRNQNHARAALEAAK